MNARTTAAMVLAGLAAAACSEQPAPPPPSGASGRSLDVSHARELFEGYPERQDAAAQVGVAAEAGDAAVGIGPEAPPEPALPRITEDNVFVDSGDSLWTRTADDRESTFAIDVDTGSYSVARTFLDQGMLPPPDSVRVEEWVNYFDHGDPAPTAGAVGLTVEAAPAPYADAGTVLVRVGVATRHLPAEERPAANVTFVVDTSGSMDIRERLGLVKASLALLTESLDGGDTISVVTYGSEAAPLLAPTPASDKGTILAAIDRLEPGGSTNLAAGLRLGYVQAREMRGREGVDVVVLASDGVANVGTTDPVALTEEIEAAGRDGIHLVTVGFGMGNYNDALMEQLADRGNGFYGYVDTFEEAQRLFVEELTPTLTVVAHDAKAQVVFDEEAVREYRLVGYENRELDDAEFVDDGVDAGELGAGHRVSALYEVRPVKGRDAGTLGEVSVRWADAGGKVHQLDRAISAIPPGTPSDSLSMAAVVAGTAEVLRGNAAVAERGVTLEDLREDAAELRKRDVPGAEEILTTLDLALDAEPYQGPSWR